ncbi:hypothetical protein BIW11_05392 [Tropilaelaps mercedesae]|uniref:Uncharacterized protein n=1 Tax=Tropilaelaps mercedesae TaxID=418985 RepID=A0A1V9Y2H7_9ACAR|nr:hypothetical protein BIW11_05392 [Tropilaelaps mercedesae]
MCQFSTDFTIIFVNIFRFCFTGLLSAVVFVNLNLCVNKISGKKG